MVGENKIELEENRIELNDIISTNIRCVIRIALAMILLNSIAHRVVYSWNQDIHPLMFFTIQSNLLLALYWLFSPFVKKLQKPSLYLAVTTYMFLTGFVFVLFLNYGFTEIIYTKFQNHEINEMVHYYSLMASVVTHYLMPVLVLTDFVLFSYVKPSKKLYMVLIYPFVYFTISMIIGTYTNKYPYPFIDPAYMGGYGYVFLAVIVLTFVLILIINFLVYLNNLVQRRTFERISNIIEDNTRHSMTK